MKILLDTCIGRAAYEGLCEAGYDVIWSADWPEDPGDAEILLTAHAEGRILITLDKDFGELAVVRRVPHAGIIRLACFNFHGAGGNLPAYSEKIRRGAEPRRTCYRRTRAGKDPAAGE